MSLVGKHFKKRLVLAIWLSLFLIRGAKADAAIDPCEGVFLGSSFENFTRYPLREELAQAASLMADVSSPLILPALQFPARQLHPTEVQTALNALWNHSYQLMATARNLPPHESKWFDVAILTELHSLIRFEQDYTSFQLASEVQAKLISLHNNIRGHILESLVCVLLVRSGFLSIRANVTVSELLGHLSRSERQGIKESEIDVMATRDGLRYWFEVKSFHPGTEFLSPMKEGLLEQIRNLVRLRRLLRSEDKVRVVPVLQFSLGEAFRDELIANGADDVIYLREAPGELQSSH